MDPNWKQIVTEIYFVENKAQHFSKLIGLPNLNIVSQLQELRIIFMKVIFDNY